MRYVVCGSIGLLVPGLSHLNSEHPCTRLFRTRYNPTRLVLALVSVDDLIEAFGARVYLFRLEFCSVDGDVARRRHLGGYLRSAPQGPMAG